MTPHALLFTLAAIGIAETAYLIEKRKKAQLPVCPIGEDCTTVLKSKYNKIFPGIHNDLLGLLFYVGIAFLTAFLVIGIEPSQLWELFAKISIISGAIFSLFLLYLQWKVIRAWCFWCIMSACTIFTMTLIIEVSNLIIN